LLFSKRDPQVANYALGSTAAVAVLSQLRQQAFPLAIELPRFTPRSRAAVLAPEWLGGLPRSVARQALLAAALAALVLALATVIPAWLAFHSAGSASSASALRSSAGVTGVPSARGAELGATTFVGGVPFVQQLRYFDGLASASPAASRFVQGARESTVVSYLQNIGTQVTLPYLNDAVSNKQAFETYATALVEAERQAQIEAAAQRAAASSWSAPPIAGGTTLSSTVTFYACVGNGFCGNMASGVPPFPGAAACSGNMPMGTRFVIGDDPNGQVFTCMDRGALSATWVDVWFYDAADGWAWQSNVGTSSEITILP
jgi:hypothetical protein